MRILRTSRLMLLALLLSLVPTSSFAGVFISVGFAPPVLPVYEQPPCPEPGWLWTPGYWAYGDDGYYWVPGAWVPAPYVGALWTPPYWGWSNGLYVFHPGYWGHHVGYYGGVNYGFGYMGVGFVGGAWHGHDFAYNTAVMRVNNVRIHNVYVDRNVVRNYTVVNDRRVAYSGGPGGIRHDPRPEERVAMHDRHEAPTRYQQEHIQAARSDRNLYVKNNGGRPQTLAVERPMGTNRHAGPENVRPTPNAPNVRTAPNVPDIHHGDYRQESRPAPGVQTHQPMQPGSASRIPNEQQQRNTNQGRIEQQSRPETRPAPQHQQVPEARPQQQPRPMPEARPMPETRQAPQYHPAPQERSQQQSRPMPESRPTPQHQQVPEARPQQQSRPMPESRPAPQYRPAPEARPQQQSHPMPESRPAPHPQQQSRPMPEARPMPQHNAPEAHQSPQQNHRPDQKPH